MHIKGQEQLLMLLIPWIEVVVVLGTKAPARLSLANYEQHMGHRMASGVSALDHQCSVLRLLHSLCITELLPSPPALLEIQPAYNALTRFLMPVALFYFGFF